MDFPIDGLTVLIVDDDASIRKTLKRALADGGGIPVVKATASEAIEALDETHFDVIILDLKLPDYGGLPLIQVLHNSHEEIPVVAISAYASPEIVANVFRMGGDDFLEKPFSPDEIRRAVGRAYAESDLGQRKGRPSIGQTDFGSEVSLHTGPIAVCLGHPEHAEDILRAAGLLSRKENVPLYALTVIQVPSQTPLKLASESKDSFKWTEEVESVVADVERRGFSNIQTKKLWTHNGSDAILEFVEEHNVEQLFLAWPRGEISSGQLTAQDIQTVAAKVSSEVALLTLRRPFEPEKIAIFVGDRLQASWAARRGWDVGQQAGVTDVRIIHLAEGEEAEEARREEGLRLVHRILNEARVPKEKVSVRVLTSANQEAALREALSSIDTVIIGASSKSKLAQQFFGWFLDDVKEHYDGNVVIVQGPRYEDQSLIDEVAERLM